MTYCDIEWGVSPKFDHDAVVINSFGETLDTSSPSVYSKRYASIIRQMKDRIMAAEDEEILKILDNIAKSGNNDI